MSNKDKLKRFWVRFATTSDDWWPIYDPSKVRGPLCWESGFTDTESFVCLLVDAESEEDVFSYVKVHWPEVDKLNFCNEHALDWLPGDRFPMNDGAPETAPINPEIPPKGAKAQRRPAVDWEGDEPSFSMTPREIDVVRDMMAVVLTLSEGGIEKLSQHFEVYARKVLGL